MGFKGLRSLSGLRGLMGEGLIVGVGPVASLSGRRRLSEVEA